MAQLHSKIIQHPTHPKHPLQELNNSTEFSCDGCHALGSGTRYNCAICEFDLHDFCASCPSTLSSHLHPTHPVHLQNKVVDDRFCDLCGDLVNGLFYSCEECEVDLHPLCTLLPPTAKHSMHPQHILKLQLEKPSWCAVCRQVCNHWRYRCNTCCLDIHPECVLESCDVLDNESETMAVVVIEKPSQAQPPPGSYKDASGLTTRGMVGQPVPGAAQPPPGKYDVFACDTATRALVTQPYQAQTLPGYDVFASDPATRALVTQHSQAQLLAGSVNVTSGLTTRGMVAPAVQLSSGYSVGVPFGGLPMQMNQGFYMSMMQPMMYYQGQGGNPGVLLQGMNYQGIMYHHGQGMMGSGIGMDQPESSNNNQGEDGKPKMGVKRKIYLAAKIAASVATLATTGVPLGMFLSSS